MHTIFVLLGVTGDLAKRKLFPALYNIYATTEKQNLDIIGVGRRDFDRHTFHDYITKETESFLTKKSDLPDASVFSAFLERVHYTKVELDNSDDYVHLKEDIQKLRKEDSQVIFYLAISPEHFTSFIDNYKNLACKNIKVIFEKPFGRDLKTAQALNTKIMEVFSEEETYRIDHYVGKEAIQNILAFRFANTMFEPIRNNKYIDNIQITAAENIGVGDRGGYYDEFGALRDMVQNHLFQVVSLVVMDAPARIDSDGIKQEKLKVLRNISLGDRFDDTVVFGQYDGYLQEKGVKDKSTTETFVAMKFEVSSRNFVGTPIYLRTGKNLGSKNTKIVVEFKEIPDMLFKKFGHIERNRIVFEVQPNEGIDIHFNIKQNGNSKEIERARSSFVKEVESKEAYEKLLEDAIVGDKTLFTSRDMLEESWRIVDELVNCKNNCPMIHPYQKGSTGPDASDALLAKDGRKWYE